MNFLRLILILIFALSPAALRARGALREGESLTYRVGWGIFTGAGEIKISAQAAPVTVPVGPAQLLVTTTTATRGFARAFFAFDARAEAIFDVATGRLHSNTETSATKDKKTKNVTTFDYATRTALFRSESRPDKNQIIQLPPGEPLDLIMSLVRTRGWDMKVGEKRDALVLFEEEIYDLTIHAVRTEVITTRLGTFETIVLEPRMEKTPPKGMFRKGSAVRVWIAQNDPRRLPVKFEVEFKFGSGVATLTAYEAPTNSPLVATTGDAKNPRP